MPADPCMKFACQLQDCLQKKRYQESECADVKEKLLDCCRAHLDESRVCDGFRGHLGRGQEVRFSFIFVERETPSPATTPSPAVSSGSNKRHPCPHCDACFTFPNKLRLHVSRRHSGAHRCGKDGCSLTFDSFNDLRAHHKASHRIRHTCSECRFVADRPALLRKHVETCHNNGVVCPIPTCGKRMAQRQLKNHLSTEHADVVTASTTNDENLPFQCERCQKRFRTRRNATKHFARAHAEKKPEKIARPRKFVCSRANCGKTFTTPQALDDHINSHEGVSPWLCNFCKRCFAARARLAVHLRKYHLISIQEVNPLRGNVS